jgi:hypothetical protein
MVDEIQNEYNELDEDFDATEESQDLKLSAESFSGIVVAPADWTIGSLYSQIGQQIDLDPDFQRRNVWSIKAKSRFIESIFLGVPIPQILLSARTDRKNSFLVLDGKQRLLSIRDFINNEFKLKDLRVIKELSGKSWKDIEQDQVWKDQFWNETQRTAVIRNWNSDKVLYEIFYRLNSGSVKLSPMELRMSLHPGEFLKFIVKWTETPSALHRLLGKTISDPRMMDVELAVRFLGFNLSDVVYRGELKEYLDKVCMEFNEKTKIDILYIDVINKALDEMCSGITAGLEIFDKGEFSKKYAEGRFERRFNRAVFDVQVGALSNPAVRDYALANRGAFVAAFKEVSSKEEFRRAVELTTKTSDATRTRFSLFYNKIQEDCGEQLDIPSIQ